MAESNKVRDSSPPELSNGFNPASDDKAPSGSMLNRKLSLFVAIGLFGLVVWTFLPSLQNGFIEVDDSGYISENAHVKAGLTWSGAGWAFINSVGGSWHPLTWFSLMLDCQVYGLHPAGHHLTDLLLHAANSVLLFLLFLHMTGALWRSAFVAALFALHPLHVESVAWAAERKDTLSTLFWMLTLIAYVRYARLPGDKSTRSRLRYGVTLALFFCGLMSKPMLVTLPVVLLLLDWWPLRRVALPLSSPGNYALLKEKLPFFALGLLISIVTFFTQRDMGAVSGLGELTMTGRLVNASLSCWRYLGETVWPLRLGAFYPLPQTFPIAAGLFAALALFVVSSAVLKLSRSAPELAFGWFWYLVTLLPVIGIIQVGHQSHADRYTYVPLIGIFAIFAWELAKLAAYGRFQRTAIFLIAIFALGACAVMTRHQIRYWKNSEILFNRALEVCQDNELAHDVLGTVFIREGRLDDGIPHLRAAIKLAPAFDRAHNDLGVALGQQGKDDEAYKEFLEAIRLNPKFAEAHRNVGLALEKRGFHNEAISQLQLAVRLKPDYAAAHRHLGIILGKQGWLNEAIDHLNQAVQLSPEDAEAHCSLGITLGKRGRMDDAIRELQVAVKLDPKNAEAQCNLGAALGTKGQIDDAIEHLRAALRLRPDYPDAERNLKFALDARASPGNSSGQKPSL